MRTYDKLIATIHARQAAGVLRSFLGMHRAAKVGFIAGLFAASRDIG